MKLPTVSAHNDCRSGLPLTIRQEQGITGAKPTSPQVTNFIRGKQNRRRVPAKLFGTSKDEKHILLYTGPFMAMLRLRAFCTTPEW